MVNHIMTANPEMQMATTAPPVKNIATEVHHLAHQSNADKDNQYIGSFHKNHVANLLNICEDCHIAIHKKEGQHKKVKTSEGYQVVLQ